MTDTAASLRKRARGHRRMGDEIAGYPDFEGRDEKARQHRSEAADLYRQARELERREGSRGDRATLTAVPNQAPSTRDGFDARRALRRSGLRAASAGDRAARKARARGTRAVKNAATSSDTGGLFLYVVASLFGLLVLDALISGRGPGGVSTAFGWLGSAVSKLVSASDPIFKQGVVPASVVYVPAGSTTSSGPVNSTSAAGQSSASSAIGAHSNPQRSAGAIQSSNVPAAITARGSFLTTG